MTRSASQNLSERQLSLVSFVILILLICSDILTSNFMTVRVRFAPSPPATCTSARRARRSSTGSTRARPAASFCCASKTPICSARPTNQRARSSKASNGSDSITTKRSFSSRPMPTSIARLPTTGRRRQGLSRFHAQRAARRRRRSSRASPTARGRSPPKASDHRSNPFRDLPQEESDGAPRPASHLPSV